MTFVDSLDESQKNHTDSDLDDDDNGDNDDDVETVMACFKKADTQALVTWLRWNPVRLLLPFAFTNLSKDTHDWDDDHSYGANHEEDVDADNYNAVWLMRPDLE